MPSETNVKQVEVPKANPENLINIIKDAYEGKVVIPEFQRSFVWAREDIEELLVSILQGYFIGNFLILDTPCDKSLFPFRPVEGLEKIRPDVNPYSKSTVRLVLDGQQRISSLFYTLYEPPINLKNRKNPCKFYVRTDLLLDGDPTDAVSGIYTSDNRGNAKMKPYLENGQAIPFSLFLDSSKFYRWLYSGQQFLKNEKDLKIVEYFYHRFVNFMVPVVALSTETSKTNIVNIFERINRTGISLSIFDLAVARLYNKNVKLRELAASFKKEHPEIVEKLREESLLKTVALLRGKEPKKSTVLETLESLSGPDFLETWGLATKYFIMAYERISSPAGGYGAFNDNLIPYSTLTVPLAAILAELDKRKGGEALYRKVDEWYWVNVLDQRYDSAVDTKTFQDLKDVIAWFDNNIFPEWTCGFEYKELDYYVDEPRSALYRGLMDMVILNGAKDFFDGQDANLNQCHDDHIFPKSKYKSNPNVNSILNRTMISERTNMSKGDKLPSQYLKIFLEKHGNDENLVKLTLRSHLISDEGYEALKKDDIDGFMEARRNAFIEEIKRRMRYA